jgi:hypothetical protein
MDYADGFPWRTYDDAQARSRSSSRRSARASRAARGGRRLVEHAELRFGNGIVMVGSRAPTCRRRAVSGAGPGHLHRRRRHRRALRTAHATPGARSQRAARSRLLARVTAHAIPRATAWQFGTYQPLAAEDVASGMHTERHRPRRTSRPFCSGSIEGGSRSNGSREKLREVPFPGVPLIFGSRPHGRSTGPTASEREESFVAGMHARTDFVEPDVGSWSVLELRLTPVAAHGSSALDARAREPHGRPRQTSSRDRRARRAAARVTIVAGELRARRAAPAAPAEQRGSPTREVVWSWEELRRTSGRRPIAELADEIGWSHRRLIARFREQVGLAPKTVARVMRFDRAVQAAALARPGARRRRVRLGLLRPGAHESVSSKHSAGRRRARSARRCSSRAVSRAYAASIPSKTGAQRAVVCPA